MSKTAEEILDTKPSMTEYPSYYSAHTVIEAMEEYAQAYHTAKLEEVVGTLAEGEHPDEINPRSKTWLEERENWKEEVEREREFSKSLQAEISTLKAEIERQVKRVEAMHQINEMNEAEIERLKGDNIEYRGEAEPTCESCIFFTADNDVPPCSICKFCDSGAKESMHQPIKK